MSEYVRAHARVSVLAVVGWSDAVYIEIGIGISISISISKSISVLNHPHKPSGTREQLRGGLRVRVRARSPARRSCRNYPFLMGIWKARPTHLCVYIKLHKAI
jgi:hypothetical protein